MNGWAPPKRSWSPQARLAAMPVLVGIAWLTGNWPGDAAWPAEFALVALAIAACHALILGVIAFVGRQRRRAAIEVALCLLFVAAIGLAIVLVLAADTSTPC